MKYAILQGDVVINVAVADEPLDSNWIEAHDASIGDVWDGEKFLTPGPTDEDVKEKWTEVRKRRDSLLSASDWTQLADAPVDDLVWAVYRQALRDLPANTSDPLNPVWPEMPA